ncbi:MAG TPA: tetratricopeptide repeat protein [Thermoanaerobaculia bacterium]|jgi:tetratricopeptide (TPR) repeat protein
MDRAAYSTRDVASLLELSETRVRAFVRAGFLAPPRGPRGELRFSFQDLVLLRAAKGLVAARISSRRVRAALSRLREQLPHGRPLTAVRILADGNRVIARDGGEVWNPESGQTLLDFEVADLARDAAPFARRAAAAARAAAAELDADDWFELGCELETTAPEDAADAYRRGLALEPGHADAHLNLGRLLHGEGDLAGAEEHFRRALAARPDDPTAAFDLGVALEDRERLAEAAAAYERALALDPAYADAHYNLAGVCEKLDRAGSAIAHWKAYRRLVGERSPD